MKTTFIYALNDPRTGECRYVGKANNPLKRLQKHLVEVEREGPTHKNRWLLCLRGLGLSPVLEVIDEVPQAHWKFWEREYIRTFRLIGVNLTNGTDGGEGIEGHTHSIETREKIGAAHRGKKLSPGRCKAIGDGMRGKKRPPFSLKHRAAIGDAHRGKKLGPISSEHRAQIIESNRRRVYSLETREKLRKAATGKSPSPETRMKISVASKGRVVSIETRKKLSRALTGKSRRLGVPKSPSHRKSIGKALSAYWRRRKEGTVAQ